MDTLRSPAETKEEQKHGCIRNTLFQASGLQFLLQGVDVRKVRSKSYPSHIIEDCQMLRERGKGTYTVPFPSPRRINAVSNSTAYVYDVMERFYLRLGTLDEHSDVLPQLSAQLHDLIKRMVLVAC
ncbi:hypothetical protein Y699_00883 [Aspergillus fumigatus Z5]|jgi:hypothetical protein|nr:hypothetical protein Y699_00883 [Aspergillus fumigatus Z5]